MHVGEDEAATRVPGQYEESKIPSSFQAKPVKRDIKVVRLTEENIKKVCSSAIPIFTAVQHLYEMVKSNP